MAAEVRTGEIAFAEAREQIEREVERHLAATGGALREVPRLESEKGNVRFAFAPPALSSARLFEVLGVIKNHIEHVRLHTFEPGFVVFQSLGENLYDSAGIASGIKFRFTTLGSAPRVEISRKANLTQDEIQACLAVFRLLVPVNADSDPYAEFARLGVSVYRKEDHEAHPDSIVGYKKTRLEIRENVILPLTRPDVFREVARLARGRESSEVVPRAVLFEGPPGVGKTTVARLIARETGIPMIYVPVENILSKYYGESAQNLAAIFDAAARLERVILFLDEIDSLAGSREQGLFEATRRVLSVLLRKIEGFEHREGVLTIGATNRAQDLDHALLSRFDQVVRFPLPNSEERAAIFGSYAVHLPTEQLPELAVLSEGFSGRNIRDLCQYAERRWARKILAGSGSTVSAPPIELYAELLRERQPGL